MITEKIKSLLLFTIPVPLVLSVTLIPLSIIFGPLPLYDIMIPLFLACLIQGLMMGKRVALSKRTIELELEKFRTAVQQSITSVVMTDADHVIFFVNNAFTDISGYTMEECLGKTPAMLKSGYHSEEFYSELRETIKKGNAWKGVFRNRKKDGTLYWERASISPIRDSEGKILFYISVKEDITEQIETLEELEKAKKEADLANKLKSQFLANMSHEIRTPLNSILGFTELLFSEESDEGKLNKLRIIKEAGNNLLDVINDVLDFSKIEANQIEIRKESFSIITTLNQIQKFFSLKAGEKGLDFIVDRKEDVPEFLIGDKQRTRQILLNLIGNALKFTDEGRVSVTAEYDEGILKITVSDTGIGISPEMLKHIFSPFNQGEGSIERKYGGTGLGLSISEKYAQLMGGSLDVESTLYKGTSFILSLPFPADESEHAAENAEIEILHIPEILKEAIFRQKGDPVLLQILHSCLLSLPESLQKIYSALKKENFDEIAFISHKEISRLGSIGLEDFSRHFREINNQARADFPSLPAINGTLQKIHSLMDEFPDFLFNDSPVQESFADKENPGIKVLAVDDDPVILELISSYLKKTGINCTLCSDPYEGLELIKKDEYDLTLLDLEMPKLSGSEIIRSLYSGKIEKQWNIIVMSAHSPDEIHSLTGSFPLTGILPKPIAAESLQKSVLVFDFFHKITGKKSVGILKPKEHLTEEEREKLTELIDRLEDQLEIFHPAEVKTLGESFLTLLPESRYFSRIETAAEQYDSVKLKQIIMDLKEYLDGTTT